MGNTGKRYEASFKRQIIQQVLEEKFTISEINKKYNLGEGTVRNWIRQFYEECENNPDAKELKNIYEENRELRKELSAIKKENLFLKKGVAFFKQKTV